MTTSSMIKHWLKEIKANKDINKREKEYVKLIKNLDEMLIDTNETSTLFEDVVREIMTKKEYEDAKKEVIHRKFRKTPLYSEMMKDERFKDFVNDEIAIARDYIKKYKIIRADKKKKGRG